ILAPISVPNFPLTPQGFHRDTNAVGGIFSTTYCVRGSYGQENGDDDRRGNGCRAGGDPPPAPMLRAFFRLRQVDQCLAELGPFFQRLEFAVRGAGHLCLRRDRALANTQDDLGGRPFELTEIAAL